MRLAIGIVLAIVFVIFGGALGCILSGLDRKVTARMQGRKGPSILQPYYDIRKLFEKDNKGTSPVMMMLCALALLFAVVAGAVFFAGGNFLLVVFSVTLSSLMFILAAYMNPSPFAQAGAQREIVQVMAYEPMVLFVAVGLYLSTGSFEVESLLEEGTSMVLWQPLIFLGFLFVLTIKLRKSPFDLSTSHHAHQELVQGTTTEMGGRALGFIEISHWYENVLFLGWVGMFIINSHPISILIAIIVVAVVWLLEILVDNNFARVKWQVMLKGAWGVALIASIVNFAVFYFVNSGGVLIF